MSCYSAARARARPLALFLLVPRSDALAAKRLHQTFIWLLMSWMLACLLSGCVTDDPELQPPAGLAYGMTSSTYQVGTQIVPNRPAASGGAIARYMIAPALPAGLSIDAVTGEISGAPTEASPSTVYTVTAQNAAGSATARVQIEVQAVPAAPAALTYREATVSYTTGVAIAPNAPSSSGGPVTAFSVTPALPAGLSLDEQTGVITGTPSQAVPTAIYTVTGRNQAGSTIATLQITVQAAAIAPASLTFATTSALYVTTEPIIPNTPRVTGGSISNFSVSPALPSGLSLNTSSGTISGTPAAVQSSAVYTITGSNSAGSVQAQVQITVTSRGSWNAAAPMLVPVHYFTATRLNDGRVLVAGGFSAGGPVARAEIFDPATNTWQLTGTMTSARSGHTATLLQDGRVLVAGGEVVFRIAVDTAEIYDPVTGVWSPAGNMSETRENHSATLLRNGKVLVAGGFDTSGSVTFRSTIDVYDPPTNTWTPMNTMLSVPRGQHAAERLPDGNVFLMGGVNRNGFITNAERIAANDNGTATELFPLIGNVTVSTLLADSTVLASADGSSNAARYVPSTSSWTTSAMLVQRTQPTMTTLADGRVLVAGGTVAGGTRTTSTEIYNPDVNTWTAGTPMVDGRNAAQAVLLTDGSVLMIGGFSGSGEVSTVERFYP